MQMKSFLALISAHEEWSFHAWRKAIANKHMEEECLLDISVGISIRASVLENLPEVSFLNLCTAYTPALSLLHQVFWMRMILKGWNVWTLNSK